ncbi:MAG TPA: RHS repeat-associated core domain-containing protein, partial [Candidatus Tectomicrobia bacterium]|nr:RHS repeat-associated core domain-containing protein [Candidatus Tectomicrobia bacterium]
MSKKQILGITATFSLLCLVLSSLLLRAQDSLPPNPDFADALWIAKTDGIKKIATADGRALLQIDDVGNVRAVAVDAQRGVLWAYIQNTLWAYRFNGEPSFSIPLTPHGEGVNGKEVVLSINPEDGTVWLGVKKSLYHFGNQGEWLTVHTLPASVRGLSWDPTTSCLWVGTQKTVNALDDTGTVCKVIELGRHFDVENLAVDPGSGDLWVALEKVLRRYDASGTLMFEIDIEKVGYLAGGPHGGAWIGTDKRLMRLDRSGVMLLDIGPFDGLDKIVGLAIDPADSVWIASKGKVTHIGPDGHLIQQLELKGEILDLALYTDRIPPGLAITAPQDGGTLNTNIPSIEFQYQDSGSGVDLETLLLLANDTDLPVICQYSVTGATCTPIRGLPDGIITLTATIQDYAGNTSEEAKVRFTVDTTPPFIALTSPVDGISTNQSPQFFAGTLSEMATLTLNGVDVQVGPDLGFAHGPVSLHEDLNAFELIATDAAANSRRLDIRITLDTQSPAAVDKALIEVGDVVEGKVRISGQVGSVEPDASVTIANTRTGEMVTVRAESDGSFTLTLGALANDVLSIVTIDAAGNVSSPTTVNVASPLPPDPRSVAPPLDRTIVTDFATATAFLYSGSRPIQIGVAPGTIEPRRAAVLRGQVQTRGGTPLDGVAITILGHPEYGQTFTRADGMFDMAVNGGGLLTVRYEKEHYLPVQRQVQAPWRDYAWLPDVVMIPYADQVARIDLTAPIDIQVAHGGVVSDGRGSRRATLLFSNGTQAAMILSDGGSQPLSTLHVRATEYTIGTDGPATMPGELPPTSGYTYAVELSVDEAMAAGASSVQFTQPVIVYVDNFLGFPIGGAVPSGYYDRRRGMWVASENGRIIRILSIDKGSVDIDADGDGTTDDASALASLGMGNAERQSLASLYQPGQSLWRVPIAHFTPWDFNWPVRLPDGAVYPSQPLATAVSHPVDDPDKQCGSIISCQNQTLGEALSVPGTPFRLHYQSDRTPGYVAARTLEVSLTGETSNMKNIILHIEVAGQRIRKDFVAAPNLTYTHTWDGKDGYGREVQGEQPVSILIGYDYDLCYAPPVPSSPSFSLTTGEAVGSGWGGGCINRTLWQRQRSSVVGHWDSRAQELGGWTLNVHHGYDLRAKALQMGDGTRRNMEPLGHVITAVAGLGSSGGSGDGGLASAAYLNRPNGLVVGRDGSVYIADSANHRIRRVNHHNMITTVAGNGTAGYSGDGNLATAAQLNYPIDIALGPDGSFYVADSGNSRIRRVGPDGIITTVAGVGSEGFSGDNQPATEVHLSFPYAIAVGPDSSLYIAEFYGSRVRRVGPEGIITTVAGTGSGGFGGDGGPAAAARLNNPSGLAVGEDGSLYIADRSNQRIRRVGTDGIITTVAGNGTDGHGGDGGLATDAQFHSIYRIAIGPDGSLYIADSNYGLFDYTHGLYVRRVRPDGIITTVAGSAVWGDGGDGGSATQARFGAIVGVAVSPDNRLYISDNYFMRVRQLGPPPPGYSRDDLIVASEGASEIYIFDGGGRHLRTLNALTATVHYQFHYDSAGRLIRIIDGNNKITTLERDNAGKPTAIVAPFGQRTTLSLNAHRYLASLRNSVGETTRLTYTTDGLLTSLTDPKGNPYRFNYDSLGRLTRDEDPAGGFKALSLLVNRTSSTTTVTTALSRKTTYVVDRLATGGTRRVNIGPSGLQSTTEIGIDGTRRIMHPDGTVTSLITGPDPRFGTQAPIAQKITLNTPSGLSSITTEARIVTLDDPLDLLRVSRATTISTVNGRPYTRTFDAASMTITNRTPMGRQSVSRLDERGRVVEQRVAGMEPLRFLYNSEGQLITVAQGSRHTLLAYDVLGRVATITDPLRHRVGFEYDAVGRVTRQVLADGREVLSTYDVNGNLTSLTPPGRPSHAFIYTAIDQEATYVPPEVEAGPHLTHYTYNLDRQLVHLTRPEGAGIDHSYDGAGRLSTLTFSHGPITFSYHPTSDALAAITDPDGETLSYDYDGSLLTRETWAGPISGKIRYTYDNDFRLTSRIINADFSVVFEYDADSLLTRVGALAIDRNAQNGLITGSTLGHIADTRTYNSFGELSSYKATSSGSDIFTAEYTRDPLGRITQKAETLEGQTYTYTYSYDVAGRLSEVKRNGTTVALYAYDSNGNRLSYTGPDNTLTGNYDLQDRLTQYGSTSYAYTANGDLQRKVTGTQTTSYEYDTLGNLRAVTLANDTQIDYVIDGRNRRVGKKLNGTLVQGFLYDGDLKPVAELDGQGQIIAQFIYGSRGNVPDYMVKGGITYRLLTDHLGSPRLVIDAATGHIVQRMAYEAFGQVIFDDNPGFQPFGFAGGLYDPDTKLTRFGARDYDAATGRWTAKDPIRFAGGDTNLYGYVLNDPVNWIDPTGLWLDTLVDVASIAYDLYRLVKDNLAGNCDNFGTNLGALGADGIGALIPFVGGLGKAVRGGGKLYHYTGANPAKIMENGLRPGASGKVFTTSTGNLTPLQAQLDLALPPNRGLPKHLIEIDIRTLTNMGVKVPREQSVTRMFNMPGGGL